MKFDWDQQTIIVTGAYGGLGSALCKELSLLGSHLIITGRDTNKLRELKGQLSTNTTILAGDVISTEFILDLEKLVSSMKTEGHILINNAGVSDTQILKNQPVDKIKHMLDINLLAPMLISKSLMPWLQSANKAKIINIGSTFGALGYPGFSAYCATKFGLRGFTQALSRELSDTNICVQYLAPRAIATAMNSEKLNKLNRITKNNVDTPVQVVPQIIKAIQKGQTEKFFGFPQKLFAKINGLFPSLIAGSIQKDLSIIKQTLK
jgi:short-subunit dehydrogenase